MTTVRRADGRGLSQRIIYVNISRSAISVVMPPTRVQTSSDVYANTNNHTSLLVYKLLSMVRRSEINLYRTRDGNEFGFLSFIV